jgi:hypothetical protein
VNRTSDPIIVVGPGRCGTSCAAGVLYRLGIFMGARLLPADATNPYGHWEDCDFVEIDEALLSGRVTRAAWTARVSALKDARNSLGIPWGLKDPRVCDLLPNYLESFNDPIFVRCIRNPDAIENSFMKAYGDRWKRAEAHDLRVRREAELDQYLPWYRTFELDFEQLRSDPATYVASLATFCEIQSAPASRRHAAVEFVKQA